MLSPIRELKENQEASAMVDQCLRLLPGTIFSSIFDMAHMHSMTKHNTISRQVQTKLWTGAMRASYLRMALGFGDRKSGQPCQWDR